MRPFVGLGVTESAVPDETTICCFRHLLERNELGKAIFEYVLEHLEGSRHQGGQGHHRRCLHHQRAVLDQEQGPSARTARPRYAPEPGRQPVVLWHEGPTAAPRSSTRWPRPWRTRTMRPDWRACRTVKRRRFGATRPTQGHGALIRDCAPNAQDMTHRRCRPNSVVDEEERCAPRRPNSPDKAPERRKWRKGRRFEPRAL